MFHDGDEYAEIRATSLLDPQNTENTKLLDKVTLISIYPNLPDCHMMIGTKLIAELWDALVEFLKKNYDVLTWSQVEVLGIDPHVITHKLFTNPDHPFVCQKRSKFTPEQLKAIEEEVLKLINANVIRESHYPNWLANIVVAPKKGESGESVSISLT